jgi:NADPH2:quinone reductase
MNAICATDSAQLELRDIVAPGQPPSGHILINIEAAAINHGDKFFLARPFLAAGFAGSKHSVWGASATGTIVSLGPDVPAEYAGRKVAIYRSLTVSPHTVGLWSEQAVVAYTSCLILPNEVAVQEYAGSLVNVITAYAFLQQIAVEGHKGVIVTAGKSATGLAIASLARRMDIPAIFLTRSEASLSELQDLGIEHAMNTRAEDFENTFARLAEQLNATVVFDGVGGELTSRIAPHLPSNSVLYIYGLLAGSAPISISPGLFLMKNLSIRRFSNFNSATVQDKAKLIEALGYLQEIIEDPMFRTKLGKTFGFYEIADAMAYESTPGAKAVLVPNQV